MTPFTSRRRLAVTGTAAVWLASGLPALAAPAEGASTAAFWWRWLAALAFCLALAIVGALALRARSGGLPTGRLSGLEAMARRLGGVFGAAAAGERRLRIVEAVRLSPNLEVCLVRCDGRDYLLAATPGGAVQLLPGPAAAAGPA
jgi:flagellar biogenesis protein FliO